MQRFGNNYIIDEWRLFVDSSKRSLKLVLVNNGNKHALVSVDHSVHVKESFDNLELVLTKIKIC